ncbi:MAG: outer membrane protein transport protein [Thermoanaerobaculia bacterium]|nr:outer membrane protein transport protein [Thermoanaerobaculia bacterium]
MRTRGRSRVAVGVAMMLALLTATASHGAGFSIFEHGSKAMGMAGAFTAQADDPSAMFHNVGGLAFFDKQEFLVGLTYITQTKADFTGVDPFPGSGTTEELETLAEIPPHLYWVRPLNEKYKVGLAINAPFGLVTEWENKDTFTGRFISTKAALTVVDINPNVGIKISDRFGLGFGAILRLAEVELNRRAPLINPFTGQPNDVATVVLESDMDNGVGWQVGFLAKPTDRFSWGFSYRSTIEVDFGGDAVLTQILTGNPQLDAVVAASLPFNAGLPIATSLEFPDAASLGFAYSFTSNLLVEVDLNWTGWSSFDQVVIDFTNDDLPDETLPQNWDDANHYRLGVRYAGRRGEWRFGYVYDETPQPDEGVGPLLPDSSRNGVTVGYGWQGRLNWDLALMYLPFNTRSTSTNRDNYNGTYETVAWLLGVTVGW